MKVGDFTVYTSNNKGELTGKNNISLKVIEISIVFKYGEIKYNRQLELSRVVP